jgi:hypothetical protein
MFLTVFAATLTALVAYQVIAIPILETLMYFAQKALSKAFGKQRKTQFVEV